jgi:hypothetical protein
MSLPKGSASASIPMAKDSQDGSEKDRNAPTVRELGGPSPVSTDTIPDLIGQYVPPRPPPVASRHRTIDLKPVRLSDEADPRRWRTERRLFTPERPAKRKRALWVTSGALLLLGLGAWALVRGLAAPASPGPAVASPPTAAAATVPTASAPVPDRTETPTTPPSPVGSTNTMPAPNSDVPKSESTLPKAPRARESPKKRKDPWLE